MERLETKIAALTALNERQFLSIEKLKYMLERQDIFIEKQELKVKDQKEDIEELKERISDFLMLDDNLVRIMRKDEYVTDLKRGKEEAMRKLRQLQIRYGNLLRESRKQ